MTIMAQGSGPVCVSGTFTVPENANSYTLSFGRTISDYIFLIEATDASKTAMMSSGSTYARGYAFLGVYPKREINNETYDANVYVSRAVPSTGVLSNGTLNNNICSSTGIAFTTVDVMASGWQYLTKGMSYNYFVVAIDD